MESNKSTWQYSLIKSIRGKKAADSSNPIFYWINLIVSVIAVSLFTPLILLFMAYVNLEASVKALEYTKNLNGLIDASRVEAVKSILAFFNLTMVEQKLIFGTWLSSVGANFSSILILGSLGFIVVIGTASLYLLAESAAFMFVNWKKKSS